MDSASLKKINAILITVIAILTVALAVIAAWHDDGKVDAQDIAQIGQTATAEAEKVLGAWTDAAEDTSAEAAQEPAQ